MVLRSVALLVALLAPLAASAQGGSGGKRIRIAVMEIRALGTEPQKAELLSEIALTEASSFAAFEVIGKSDIGSMIGFEKQKQVAGCTEDSNCLAEVGGALGVDFILVGSLGRMGTLYRLDLKLVEIKKARVRARMGINVEGSEEKLVAGTQKIVRDMLAPEAARADPGAAVSTAPAFGPDAAALAPPRTVAPGTSGPGAKPDRPAVQEGRWRTASIATAGVGVALVVGGALAGLQAKSAFQAEKDASASGDLKAYEDNKSKAKTMSIAADALFVTGSVGIGVGTWLFFSGRSAASVSFDVTPTPGGAFASISGGF